MVSVEKDSSTTERRRRVEFELLRDADEEVTLGEASPAHARCPRVQPPIERVARGERTSGGTSRALVGRRRLPQGSLPVDGPMGAARLVLVPNAFWACGSQAGGPDASTQYGVDKILFLRAWDRRVDCSLYCGVFLVA